MYRKRIKHGRENLTELLDTMQIKTLRDFLDITLALSVTDTFWVKSVDSDLTWDKISPYAHCFNPVVADIALNGNTELCSWSQL